MQPQDAKKRIFNGFAKVAVNSNMLLADSGAAAIEKDGTEYEKKTDFICDPDSFAAGKLYFYVRRRCGPAMDIYKAEYGK